MISFSCTEFKLGLPINPVFVRTREDLDWETVCRRSNLPYRLTNGSCCIYVIREGRTVGPIPKCKTCKSKLERNKPRIEVVVTFIPSIGGTLRCLGNTSRSVSCKTSLLSDFQVCKLCYSGIFIKKH